jgi:integrase/recombinase XerD
MSIDTVSPLRQRMIEDMNARKLCAGAQRGHIRSCKRFAAFLKRSPDTATPDDIRRFRLHLAETGVSICTRNGIMTGLKFLLRVTLRRLDLAAEIYHLREPQKIPLVMSQDETQWAARAMPVLPDGTCAEVARASTAASGKRSRPSTPTGGKRRADNRIDSGNLEC